MVYRYDLANTHFKVYYESNSEFEEIRTLCLQEDNWLKHNYIKENLKIEEHSGYGVIFQTSTGEPMVMGGVFNDGRYPSNVAKMINRLYTFPKFRMTHTDMTDGFRVTCKLIDELVDINDFECYLITMQNRANRPSKAWWTTWVKHMELASNNSWTLGNGYIQTCPHNVQKCWQNFVYRDITSNAFNNWKPEIITHDQWASLLEGK